MKTEIFGSVLDLPYKPNRIFKLLYMIIMISFLCVGRNHYRVVWQNVFNKIIEIFRSKLCLCLLEKMNNIMLLQPNWPNPKKTWLKPNSTTKTENGTDVKSNQIIVIFRSKLYLCGPLGSYFIGIIFITYVVTYTLILHFQFKIIWQ